MKWDTIEGKWEQFKGQARQQWGKLTDDDLLTIKGKKQELIGKLQERYGYGVDQAEDEVAKFCSSCSNKAKKGSEIN